MRLLTLLKYTVLLGGAIVIPSAQSEVGPLSSIEIGRNYLDALYAFDLPELKELLHPDAVFEDPTSVVAFPGMPWRFEGRSAVLGMVRQSGNGVVNAEYRVVSEFSTGEYVVFYLEYSMVLEGEMLGANEQEFSIKVPAATILKLRDDLVIHHIDYANYDLMLEQMAKQSGDN